MDMWDLKKWRRKLGYSQFEAAENLGVSRAAIQHWECERTPIPHAVDLACEDTLMSPYGRMPIAPHVCFACNANCTRIAKPLYGEPVG